MKNRSPLAIALLAILCLALLPAAGQADSLRQDTSVAPAPPGERFVVRIYYDSVEDARRLTGFDLFEYNNVQEKYFLAAVDADGYARLQALGFRVELDAKETAAFNAPRERLPDQVSGIPGYPCYRTVEETFAAAQALVTARPDLAAWLDRGNSWEKFAGLGGYDMWVLKLTNSAIPGPKPKLFVTAAIHAREYTTAELVTRFGEYLVNNYGTDPDATWLLDWHEIHLMLQTNPDGRKQAEAGKSWRKNTNQNYCGPTSNNRGADLNRNFAFKWGCCGGSSGDPCDETYRGASAGSEPETQAVQNHAALIFPDQRGPGDTDPAPANATGLYIDVHSYSQLVLWPWGWTSTNSPNSTQLQTLGRKFAFFNNYTPQKSYSLYPTDGTTDDQIYGVLGVAAYTFELGTMFFQACTYFENTIMPGNMPALIYAAKVARTPYMTPAGPDALNLAVSPASVASGDPTTLTATINDTRYKTGTGEPTQNIAAAEYYIDMPPWNASHEPISFAMAPADGSFNSTVEGVTATVSTGSLAAGKHIIFVRGKDATGNWGAFSAIFLTVTPCTAPGSVNNLAIARVNSSQVNVTWSSVLGAHHYEVWSAANEPYFAPGANCSNPAPYACTSTTGTSFLDASLGSPATHTVYVVRAAKSCGAVSGPGSGRVGEFEYSVVPGN